MLNRNNHEAIVNYLKYLKDVSRKISVDSGFEKSLLNNKKKNNNYVLQIKGGLSDSELIFSKEDKEYIYFKDVIKYLEKHVDKKLFIGVGLVCGSIDNNGQSKKLAGPLLIAECNIGIDADISNEILCEIKLSTLVLNYDLISSILESKYVPDSEEDNDYYDPKLEKEAEIIEEIENILENVNDISKLKKLAEEIAQKLQRELEEFKDMKIYSDNDYYYDYEEEKRRTDSIFSKNGIYFINAMHFFVERIPNELSAYESLSLLLKEIKENGSFENEILKSLLNGAFSGNPKVNFEEDIFREIEKFLDFLPISLSRNQIEALLNAFSSEISYIQGPPGTGKSHTILAIVLLSVLLGKKVLVVSQKVPAVNVINEKVTPFLKFDINILPVVYYNKSIKVTLRESAKKLIQISNNYSHLLEIEKTENELKTLEEELKHRLKKLKKDEEKLFEDIDRENKIYNLTKELQELLNKFENKYFKVNRITRYVEEEKLKVLRIFLEKLKFIEEKRIDNLATLRFKLNIIKLLVKELPGILKKETILDLFGKYLFHRMMEDIIEIINKVNCILEEERKLLHDRELIKKDIRSYKQDIISLGKNYIVLKNKYNILSKLKLVDYNNEFRKFSNLLRFSSVKKIAEVRKSIDWSKLLDIYPIWISEIRNINEILPMKANLFDLVIVDEASQVNLAEILPVFYRGKKICIVGDHKQLNLESTGINFRLSKNLDRLTWEKYKPNNLSYKEAKTKKLTVTTSSILDFIRSEENGFFIKEVMLDEHFRSLPKLARFTNDKFYEGKLKIMTETPDKEFINPFFPIKVDGKREGRLIYEEVEEVVNIIRSIITSRRYKDISLPDLVPYNFSIGVLSFSRNQVELIKDYIYKNLSEEIIHKYDIVVGTPEELQGHEKDVVIISFAVDENSKRSRVHYEKKERFNVATSRAKYFTFFVYSGIPSNFTLTISYFKHFGFTPHIEEGYVEQVETIDCFSWSFNPEVFESELERVVYEYLEKYINMKRQKNIYIDIFNQVRTCGYMRLDFVLYNPQNKKFVAVEVDGIHHFELDGRTYSQAHKERIEIIKRAGWNIINTPYYRWYRGGWLDDGSIELKKEVERIYKELDEHLF